MWMGSHDKDVTHLVCPRNASPTALPVFGSHRRTWPSCPPLASFLSRASHSTQSTQPLWPDRTCDGSSVLRSHRRALLSPEPVASIPPVGEKDAQSMGAE